MFWQDNWNGQELQAAMPELFSFARNKLITARKVLDNEDLTQLFHLPISEIAFEQMQQME